jgi:hypothetical protein
MIELAEQVRMIEPGTLLPTGVIVESAVIERGEDGHATDNERLSRCGNDGEAGKRFRRVSMAPPGSGRGRQDAQMKEGS